MIVEGTGASSGRNPTRYAVSGNDRTSITLSGTISLGLDSRYIVVKGSKKDRDGDPVVVSVRSLLADSFLWDYNYINMYDNLFDGSSSTREKLITYLGIADSAFKHVPVLFEVGPDGGAIAYTPDMVNSYVGGGGDLTSPKPFGPKKGVENGPPDAFEDDFGDQEFVDDWEKYHRHGGEVHCGTNAKRKIRSYGSSAEWWNEE